MAFETTFKPKLDVVGFLEDVEVNFVSLVPKGANWTPFRVKCQKGEAMPGQIIQSVILPNTAEWDALIQDPEYAWLAEYKAAKIEKHNEYTAYVQCDKADFVGESFKATSLGKAKGLVISGVLNTQGELRMKNAAKAAPDSMTVALSPEAMAQSMAVHQEQLVGDMINRELWRFQDVLWATLSRSALAPTKRRTIVMASLGGFWDFLDAILSAIGAEPIMKNDDTGSVVNKDKNSASGATKSSGGDDMTPEEIKTMVGDVVKAEKSSLVAEIVAEVKAELAKVQPAVPSGGEGGKTEAKSAEPTSEVVKAVTELSKVVTEQYAALKAEVAAIQESAAKKGEGDEGTEGSEAAKATTQTAQAQELEKAKADLMALQAKVESLEHSTSAAQPSSDPDEKKKGAGSSWDGAWVG